LALIISCLVSIAIGSTTSPYSVDFDLHNMAGIDDNTINAEDIVAFIQEKYPNSPMLSEADVGNCFINAGQTNNVNPAFLVATACLEGGFGTLGRAQSYPECHNTFGYGIPSGSTQPDDYNCMDSWCAMVQRVASVIAHGTNYYSRGLITVSQVRAKYAASPNADSIADLMNELYSFSVNHKATGSHEAIVRGSPSTGTQTQETLGEKAAERSRQLVGAPYTYGGRGYENDKFLDVASIFKVGIDCSGLVFWAFNTADGLTTTSYDQSVPNVNADTLWKNEVNQLGVGSDKVPSESDLEPGDLLFIDTTSLGTIDHVGMYVGTDSEGTGYVVHAKGGYGSDKGGVEKLTLAQWLNLPTLTKGKTYKDLFAGYGRVKADTLTELPESTPDSAQQGPSIVSMQPSTLGTAQPLQMLNSSTPTCLHHQLYDECYNLSIKAIAFSPDGKKLAIFADSQDTSIWDVASGTMLQTMKEPNVDRYYRPVVFSPDSSKLAMCNSWGEITIYDVNSGERLQWMTEAALLLAFTPDGSKLVTCDWSGNISTWDVARGTKLQTLKTESGRRIVYALSCDGSKLATCNYDDRTTRIWDVASGTMLHEIKHNHPVVFVAFNLDGSKLATNCAAESEITIWDVNSGEKLQISNLDKDTNDRILALSPDGNKLVGFAYEGMNDRLEGEDTIKIWDATSGTKLQELKYHTQLGDGGSDRVVAFSPDSTKLATGHEDGYTLIWGVTKAITTPASKKSGAEELSSQVIAPMTGQNTTARLDTSKPLQKSPGFAGILTVTALLCIFILWRKD
jgi:WD40 repeat protein